MQDRDSTSGECTTNDSDSEASFLDQFFGEVSSTLDGRLPDGTRVGRYKVENWIASGGMANVYLASDTQFTPPRSVVLKIIKPELVEHLGDEAVARFRAEANYLSRLNDAGLVRILDVGEWCHRSFLVLEHVDGPTLAELCDERRLTFREIARLVRDCARAIDKAHSLRIVHRDLKPSNILVIEGPGGELIPKVTDFGIAKTFEDERISPEQQFSQISLSENGESGVETWKNYADGLTTAGQIIGTIPFMSPEQISAQPDVDQASDIWALGIILYQLTTGELPFRIESKKRGLEFAEELGKKICEDRPPALRSLVASAPKDFESICHRALAKRREDRFPTAKAMSDDLTRFLDGRPTECRPVSRIQRAVLWARRSPGLAAAAATAALALLAVVIVSITFASVVGGKQREAIQLLSESRALTTELSFNVGMRLAEQGRVREGMLWMADALRELDGDRPELENAIRLSIGAWDKSLRALDSVIAPEQPMTAWAISPDGRFVVTASIYNKVQRWNRATGTPIGDPVSHASTVNTIQFADDGSVFATGCADGTVRVIANDSEAGVHRRFKTPSVVRSICFLPDENRLAVAFGEAAAGSASGGVRGFDWKRGTDFAEPLKLKTPALCLDRRGMQILVGLGAGQIGVLRESDLKVAFIFDDLQNQIMTATFSADERRIVAVKEGFQASIFEAAQTESGMTWRHKVIPTQVSARTALFLRGERFCAIDNGSHCQLVDTLAGLGAGSDFPHTGKVRYIAATQAKDLVLTGTSDHAKVWSDPGISGRPKHLGVSYGGALSRDHRKFCAATINRKLDYPHPNKVKVINVDGSDEGWETPTGLDATATAWRVDETSGDEIVIGFVDGTIRWWSPPGKPLSEPLKCGTGAVRSLSFNDDGSRLCVATEDGKLTLLDAQTHSEKYSLMIPATMAHGDAKADDLSDIFQVRFRPGHDELALAVWGKKDGTGGEIQLRNADDGKFLSRFRCVHSASALAFSADGNRLAIADGNNDVRVLEVTATDMKNIAIPMRHSDRVVAVAFSVDGRFLLTGTATSGVHVWNSRRFRRMGPPLNFEGSVRHIVCTSSGEYVVVARPNVWVGKLPSAVEGTAESVENRIKLRTGMILEKKVARLLSPREWLELRDKTAR